MKIDDKIRDEAAQWFAASRRGPMALEERAAFDAWRANPLNQAALNHMHETWGELAGLKQIVPGIERRADRRAWRVAAAVAAILVASLGGFYLTYAPSTQGSRIETATGEQRSATLADGSVINVNVATRLSYNLGARDRVVDMGSGEAAFFVHHDKSKPFFVRTGAYEVRAVGTAFNVRNRGGTVDVSVLQGTVSVTVIGGSHPGRQVALISAGKRIALDNPDALAAQPVRIDTVDPQSMIEWRARTLDYEDAPISRVVEDLNAFFPRPITVGSALGSRRITIRLRVDDREHALQTLTGLLDLRLDRGKDRDALVDSPGS
jgi:transmembrane sensor